MASIDEMMSHKNKEPKWMTESEGKGKSNNNNKESSTPSKPKTPVVPKTDFKVKLCCHKCEEIAKEEVGEVDGVMSVVTDASKSKVTVMGHADAVAVLKKLKKHVNSKAAYWPEDPPNPSKKHVTFKEGTGEGEGLGKGEKSGKGENRKGEKGGEKGKSAKGELNGYHGEKGGESDNDMEHGEAKKGNKKGGNNGNNNKDLQGMRPPFEYVPMDPREFVPVTPWAGGGGGYGPHYYESHGGGDPRERMMRGDNYQPKPSYFSDYRPSQSYPANYRSTDEYSDQPITNPDYIKQIY